MSSDKGTPNHAKIWGTAVVAGWVARFIFVSIFFRVMPYEVMDMLIPYWTAISWLLLFAFIGGIGAILMAKGVFHEGGAPASSFSPGASAASSGGANLVMTGDGAADGVYPVEMALNRRHCKGDLYLLPDRLMFVSYVDQSIFKANAGQAGGSQGGLIGALIGGLIAHSGAGKRAETEAANRAAADAMPVNDRAKLNEFSWSFTPNEIELVKASIWKGSFIKAGGKKHLFHQAIIPDEAKAALQSWCAANGVAAEL